MTEKNTLNSVSTPTPRRIAWWKIVLLVFALGPLPTLIFVFTIYYEWIPYESFPKASVICSAFGAYWGVIVGLMKRRLLNVVVGLNAGIVVGAFTGWVINDPELYAKTLFGYLPYNIREGPVLWLGGVILGGLVWCEFGEKTWLASLKCGARRAGAVATAWVALAAVLIYLCPPMETEEWIKIAVFAGVIPAIAWAPVVPRFLHDGSVLVLTPISGCEKV